MKNQNKNFFMALFKRSRLSEGGSCMNPLPMPPFPSIFCQAIRQGPGYSGICRVAGVVLWLAGTAAAQVMTGPNKLTYFPLPAASEPGQTWTRWKASYFTPDECLFPGISSETADPDGDAIGNLMEYAAGRNPRVSDADGSVLQVSSLPGGGIQCSAGFSSLATGLDVFYEQSTDLSTWTRVSHNSPGLILQSGTGRRPHDGHAIRNLTLTNTGLTGAGRFFYRIMVLRVP